MQSKCYRSVTVLYFFYYFYDELHTINIRKDGSLRSDNTTFHTSEPYF